MNKLAVDTDIFGEITPPASLSKFDPNNTGAGIGNLLNLGLKLLIVGAVIYSLFNFVLAGYAFLSAGDDSKKIEGAWAKIWQTALGLAFAAGAYVLAGIFGWLIFGSWDFILNPAIPTLTP
ncbi:MAG: hypothetical protein AAB546_00510 [Patescibacteria group bacterium]